ncbi:MAG: conjugal transfer protein MobB [Chitinophagaceae bacterium]
MVAKIGHGEKIIGALSYNQLKVKQENGEILLMQKMVETPDGNYTVAQLSRSFEPYLLANRRTEKPVLHISLNPDPRDEVGDAQFKEIAQRYMQQMGYGEQPFVVFKHTDTSRTHIHIVSVCVDQEGKKIPDAFERRHSMDVCRSLEQQYNLVPATEKGRKPEDKIFQPVDYRAGDIKSQIASVVRHLPRHYRFQGFGNYNALLSLFNIAAEEVRGELHGQPKAGLVYFALNEQGEKAGNPFKASLFGKTAGYTQLQMHYERSKESLKNNPAKALLKNTIEAAMHSSMNEAAFKQQLLEQAIHAVVRRNAEGRVYGITFIGHDSKTVWNGSQFGKNLSANAFNDWWNNANKPQATVDETIAAPFQQDYIKDDMRPRDLFDFLNKDNTPYTTEESGMIDILGGLLPGTQGEDYEEQAFANRMKKKKKRKPGGPK